MLQGLWRLSSCLFTAAGSRGSRCEQRAARGTETLCTRSRASSEWTSCSDEYEWGPEGVRCRLSPFLSHEHHSCRDWRRRGRHQSIAPPSLRR